MSSRWFGFASHPRGLRTLFFAELWERFSYYGMRAELVLFLTASAAEGGLGLPLGTAGLLYGNWAMAVYLLAIPGGSIADLYLGARRAALAGGTLITCGHFTLAMPSAAGLPVGLTLIACGTGLFKPSISTLVGALYRPDDIRRDAGFLIFYAGINLGAVAAPLVTGALSQSAWFKAWLAAQGFDPTRSWHWGFAAAGLGMLLSLVVLARAKSSVPTPTILVRGPLRFSRGGEMALTVAGTLALLVLLILSDLPSLGWLRVLFVAVPAVAIAIFAKSRTIAARRMAVVFVLFVAATLFTAITEQAAVSIALFADRLTRSEIWSIAFPSMWFQSLNPLFVIVLGPVVAAAWTGLGTRQPSALGKFAIGLTVLAASYGVMVVAAHFAVSGKVGPGWLVGLFLLQALAELCVGPVGLSTMTKLAPAGRTALMLGVWFLAAAFGSKLAGILGSRLTPDAPAQLSRFFLDQVLLLLAASAVLAALDPWSRRLTAPWPADRDPDADRHIGPRTMHAGSPTSESPSLPASSGLAVQSRGQLAPRVPLS